MDASARTLVAARNGVDLDLARLLRNFRSLGLHRHIGFDTFAEYVRERLAISPARANMLARLDYKLYFLPQTAAAVRRGEVGLVAADLISRVAQPETEPAWIAAARLRTVARVRKDVEWVLREADRSDWSDRWPPPPDALPSALDLVTAGLRGEPTSAPANQENDRDLPDEQMFAASTHDGDLRDERTFARAAQRGDEAPAAWIRVSTDDDWRNKLPLGELEWQAVWRGNDERVPALDENGIPFAADPAALRCRPEIERAFNIEGCPDDASSLRVDDRVLQMSAPQKESMGLVQVRFQLCASALALWNRAEYVVAHQQENGLASDGMVLREVAVAFLIAHLPLWVEALDNEDPIAVRARFSCQIPGCDMWGGSGHHVRLRSQLGTDDAWNLEFICFDHHIPGVHGGRLRIYGTAPNGLVVELGLRADGRPLERWVRWGTLLHVRQGAKSHAA